MGAIQRKSGLHVSAALALAIGLALPLEATAHQDPPGCLGIDNSMRLVVTRNNGDPVVGTVSECETIKFQARLQWVSECLIEGGTFKVVTPDGVDHVVETPVRCLGDATVNDGNCAIGQDTEINSAIIDYTVSPGDAVGGQLTAMAVWENGILHQSPTNVTGQGDERAIEVTMELCDDGLFCNGLETCDPAATDGVRLGICVPGTPPNCGTSDQCAERGCDEENDECFEIDTSGRCGASDFCVDRGCNPETGCFEIDNSDTQCPDEFCTERECNPEGGCIDTDVSGKCGASDQCTDRSCDEVNDECDETDTSGRCGESDFCVDRGCDPETGCTTVDNSETQCPDEFCTERECNPEGGCIDTDVSGKCGSSDECTDRSCDEVNDECDEEDTSGRCDDEDACTEDLCDPETGCQNPDIVPPPAECAPLGCRITGGGVTPDGQTDPGQYAETKKQTFGGQVGAPCGCIGCFDEFDNIQGNWTHVRHSRKGRFHASGFNSLVCGCDGVLDGELCNPGDREQGPEPRRAPANLACWSGIGDFERETVAFRVEVQDRGEPGAGRNAGLLEDFYRIRIWTPTGGETAEELADDACCTNQEPVGRAPDLDDGGHLVHGNIQIHPVLPNTERDICPPPSGSCSD